VAARRHNFASGAQSSRGSSTLLYCVGGFVMSGQIEEINPMAEEMNDQDILLGFEQIKEKILRGVAADKEEKSRMSAEIQQLRCMVAELEEENRELREDLEQCTNRLRLLVPTMPSQ
jgi:seryl-tRNA synthetase